MIKLTKEQLEYEILVLKKSKRELARQCGVSYTTMSRWAHHINLTVDWRDMIGKKFGRLTVLDIPPIKKVTHNHYTCLCECGNTIVVNGTKLSNGHTRSCGCLASEASAETGRKRRLPNGIAMRNRVLSNYKQNAKNKGYEWALTDEEAIALFQGDCHYCGSKPSLLASRGTYTSYTHNGIDRKENDSGYTIENSVSCCMQCNYKKGDQNYLDFIEWVGRVYSHLKDTL